MGERCKAVKENGLQCKNITTDPSGYCAVHPMDIDELSKLQELEKRIHQLEKTIAKLNLQRNTGDRKQILSKFYHANKNNEHVLNDIKQRLSNGGLPTDKIPWTYVKKYTDNMFDMLPEEEQLKWHVQ